jgi:taurine dioxygenase
LILDTRTLSSLSISRYQEQQTHKTHKKQARMQTFLFLSTLLGMALTITTATAADADAVVNMDDTLDLSAPWFGAAPPENGPYEMHRRGWQACLRCGGAERLGAIVDVGDLSLLNATSAGAAEILDAVRAHGMVVIQGQNLTRQQQVAFSAALGEVIVLPSSFEGKDPEPFHPAIQRITNFWANNTWKGPGVKFGAYWHQDGQFWVKPKHNVLSVLHAQATPPEGGETGFADLRAARATLSKPLRERAAQASILASVHDIADFAKGTQEDLAAFPDAQHAILDHHSSDGGPLLYVGSPHMKVGGLESPEAGRALLDMLLVHATSPSFTYFHAWDVGDVIVWDNTQTLHHAMPYNNDGTAKRELYRTQARILVPNGGDDDDDSASSKSAEKTTDEL